MGFQQILEKYRRISFSELNKGDRFERLMQAYLQTDLYYANRLLISTTNKWGANATEATTRRITFG